MKILVGADPANPAPPELAEIITTPDSNNPAPTTPRLKKPAKTAAARAKNIPPRAKQPDTPTQQLIKQLRRWLEKEPQLQPEFNDYLTEVAEKITDKLRKALAKARAGQKLNGDDLPDTMPPGDPRTKPNNTPRPDIPRLIPAKQPPYTLQQSAEQSAIWLAQRWPTDVKEQGTATFIEARIKDVIDGIWTPKYWQQLDRLDPAACVSIAHNTEDPDWDTPPFNDPLRHRSIVTYTQASAPYPLPAPYSTGPQPSPGFTGEALDEILQDTFHAAWIEYFKFPDPYFIEDMAPVFLDTYSHHYCTADEPPSKIQFGTHSLPILYSNDQPGAEDTISLVHFARRYNWTSKIPPGGAGPYHGHMRRHFIQDCRVLSLVKPDPDGICDRLRVKIGPLAAWGKYYGKARDIQLEYLLESPAAYVAKIEANSGAAIDWSANIAGSTGWHYDMQPLAVGWNLYLYRQQSGVPIPATAIELGFNFPALPLKTPTVGYGWSAPVSNAPTLPEIRVRTIGPTFQLLGGERQAEADAHNWADFGKAGGDTGYGTIWHTANGGCYAAPGIISLGNIARRTPPPV